MSPASASATPTAPRASESLNPSPSARLPRAGRCSETRAMAENVIHPPYIWFGGKRKVAPQIWRVQGEAGEHERRGQVLRDWMLALRDRLRNVRVCCGEWERVCTDGATAYGATVGVFLDPPYSAEANRHNSIYRCEDPTVAH